jgi:predicted nuclease of restriction endonuclease-like (RecB) superfamily
MMSKKPVLHDVNLFNRVVEILEQARTNVVRAVNSQMVISYWLIGREIVEEEQRGDARAEYGKQLIEDLSRQLTQRYGKGFSTTNLRYFRQFYLSYANRIPVIRHPSGGELPLNQKRRPIGGECAEGFHPQLGWSHYRALMRVENEQARSFYEIEATRNRWNKNQLERQINSLLFERLSKSRDKEGVLQLADEGQTIEKPVDAIKDPYVLEFLDLPETHRLVESDLEEALITHLQEFLLELGSGFAFVGRQTRLTLDGDHFYPDLVFYHIKLKCYIVIDLKVGKLTHSDLGQMQMYVHYYDREVCTPPDNPTIGLILCTDKNDAVVRYVLDEANRQIFASRYRLELPSEEELRRELERERRLLEEQESGFEVKEGRVVYGKLVKRKKR